MSAQHKAVVAVMASRLPAYLRDGFPKFVEMMTAYYDWLLDAQQPAAILKHRDLLDADSPQGVDVRLLRDLGLEEAPAASRRELMAFARTFNASRGSVNSYVDYFRIYFGAAATIKSGATTVMTCSDVVTSRYERVVVAVTAGVALPSSGELKQPYSGAVVAIVAAARIAGDAFHCYYEVVVSGDTSRFYWQPVVVSSSEGTVAAAIVPTWLVSAVHTDYRRGDVVAVTTDVMTTTGVITKTVAAGISAVQILQGGNGYRRGDVIMAAGNGQGFSAQVAAVNNGAIAAVEVLSPGRGYDEQPAAAVGSTNGVGAVLRLVTAAGAIAAVKFEALPYGDNPVVTTAKGAGIATAVAFTAATIYRGVNGVLGAGSVLTDSRAVQFSSYTVETAAPQQQWVKTIREGFHPAGRYMHVVSSLQTDVTTPAALTADTIFTTI